MENALWSWLERRGQGGSYSKKGKKVRWGALSGRQGRKIENLRVFDQLASDGTRGHLGRREKTVKDGKTSD